MSDAMSFYEKSLIFHKIFNPGLIEERSAILTEKKRFVYYTSAATAMKVLCNQELWFRNSTVMSDFSEVSYGLDLIRAVFLGPEGERFRNVVESLFSGTIKRADELLSGWERDWRLETYISCVSLHDPSEDDMGRLSMWRAYGDTALVIKNTPMTAITDLLAVYSIPVLYISEREFSAYLSKITESILVNRDYLIGLGQDTLVNYIHQMLFRLAIATKHPGFAEEKEWRLYYRPSERESPKMTKETVVLNGVPQVIYKLALAHEPESGLHGADIPSLLDRIIVGPNGFPYVSYKAFVEVLKGLGVTGAADKVIVSDIPLRTR